MSDNNDFKKLSIPEKAATTQALTDLGYSVRKIASILGIDEKTVLRYQNKELEPQWEQFANAVKKMWFEQDAELAALAIKGIKEKLPKARFYELVGLYKTIRDFYKEQPSHITAIRTDSKEGKVEFVVWEK